MVSSKIVACRFVRCEYAIAPACSSILHGLLALCAACPFHKAITSSGGKTNGVLLSSEMHIYTKTLYNIYKKHPSNYSKHQKRSTYGSTILQYTPPYMLRTPTLLTIVPLIRSGVVVVCSINHIFGRNRLCSLRSFTFVYTFGQRTF